MNAHTAITAASELAEPLTFHTCLVGARRWIERGLAEAQRLNDRQCETEFQAILDTFDTEASGLHDIIAEANDPCRGEPL